MKMSKVSGAAIAASAASLLIAGAIATPTPTNAAEMVKCFGVNACKGTNACKSSKNACKGTNACKGQGWVAMTKAECEALSKTGGRS